MKEIIVSEDDISTRIDRIIRRYFKELSLSEIYQLIENGDILLNGKKVKPSHRVQPGDKIFIPFENSGATRTTNIPSREINTLKIIFEDDYIIIAEKRAGIPVHSGSGWDYGLVDILGQKYGSIFPVHRLDKDTSGLIIFARNRITARNLSEIIKKHNLTREYLALVKGRITKNNNISLPIEKKAKIVEVSEKGKEAITKFSPEKIFPCCTLLKLRLYTGRTHQIRVHLSKINHPVAGDWKYGDKNFNIFMKRKGLKRLFLHSHHLIMEHPVSKNKLEFWSPLPEELEKVLSEIR